MRKIKINALLSGTGKGRATSFKPKNATPNVMKAMAAAVAHGGKYGCV